MISLDLIKQKVLCQGQINVALSRITSMDRLYLIGKSSKATMIVNTSVKIERLRSECKLSPASVMLVSESTFTLTLLNIRYQRKYFTDVVGQCINAD